MVVRSAIGGGELPVENDAVIIVDINGVPLSIGGGAGGGASAADINAALKASPQPIIQAAVTIAATVVSVPANTSTTLVAANAARKTLSFMNIGLNPATITLGNAASVVGQGMALDGAPDAGNQGGAYSFDGTNCPTVRLGVISTLGTTFVIWEGA
jgi:hypothetical protein